jgi:hypothetical protein
LISFDALSSTQFRPIETPRASEVVDVDKQCLMR